jgi:hypothetical protein
MSNKEVPENAEVSVITRTIVFEASHLEIRSAKPAVPLKLPREREIHERPSPVPDPIHLPQPTEIPTPSTPVKEPVAPNTPVPAHR